MSILLFANNATTTIAAPINGAAVTVTVATGKGALFPNPSAGQYFVATLVDAATGLVNEIVNVTARSGDTLTIVRAQEGTSAASWLAGDTLANYWTAAQATAMVQQAQAQAQAANYAVDTGLVNAMVVTLSPVPASLAALLGTPIRVKVNVTNTIATPAINVNGFGAQNVVTVGAGGVGVCGIGSCAAAKIIEVVWDGTNFQFMNRVSTASAAMILAGTDVVSPITSAGLLAAMPHTTPFGGGAGASAYQQFPSGLIMQWGNFTTTSGVGDSITLPVTFANRMMSSVCTANSTTVQDTVGLGPASAPPVSAMLTYVYQWNGTTFAAVSGRNISWLAIGY